MSSRLLVFCLFASLLTAPAVFAQEAAPGAEASPSVQSPEADQPRAEPAPAPAPVEADPNERPAIPVAVVHQGDDPLGIQLAFALKETFSSSPLFRLAGAEDKRITVRVTTLAEFPARPSMGTCFGLTWAFAEKSDVLAFFLEDGAGCVSFGETGEQATAIAARTDAVADRFGYLFE